MAGKSKYDWEAIWVDYRAGIPSINEVGKKHGVDPSYICRKAKELGIKRDLTNRVKQEVRTKLVHGSVHTPGTTDDKIIENESDRVVEVVKLHRKDIGSGREAVNVLLGQLTEAAANRDDIKEDIERETAEDQTIHRKNQMLKAVSLQTHSSVAVNLSNALKNLIGLERQAFSLDDGAADKGEQGFIGVSVDPRVADILNNPDRYTPETDE